MRGLAPVRLVMAVVLGGALLSSGCLMRAVEDRFIFFPTRPLVGSPKDIGLDYSSVHLVTDDGVRLHGWWVPADPERGVVLFFHGNAGNISDRLDSIRIFNELGLSVFIFDYRGYGQSEGEPSEQGTYRDGEAAWRYLTEERHIDPARILMFGRSLGAAVAAETALEHKPRALILESAFTSIPAMARASMPWLPVGPFLRTHYDTLRKIGSVACPVLVVHSRDDEIIPFAQGKALFDAAHEPKAFLELRYGHNEGFILSGNTYTEGLEAFVGSQLGPRPARKQEKSPAAEAAPKGGAPKPEPSPFSEDQEPPRAGSEEFTD
jgi:hypothetical protein